MSFSSDVKEELSARLDSARHCQIAEFAALMGMSGRIRRSSGGEMQQVHVHAVSQEKHMMRVVRMTQRTGV